MRRAKATARLVQCLAVVALCSALPAGATVPADLGHRMRMFLEQQPLPFDGEVENTTFTLAWAGSPTKGVDTRAWYNYVDRDDQKFLCHTMVYHQGLDVPRVGYLDVVITKSPPGVRDYSGDHK